MVSGSNAYPQYFLKCKDCSIEFSLSDSEENIKLAQCTACGSNNVEVLYMSFGSDGPGFQKDYANPSTPCTGNPDSCFECSSDNCSKDSIQ
ncbi:hypothetical protein LPY66_11075 [Dehalobacter sp. DCM]|uniref:hypothetical protein n=1 Tax=Dehalobacter sp. DCM TaxID=2907827 RepID=UPI003082132F|nr:hypothetical protein LPY66_11075 [Dehalobacter sp. DCM]